MGFSSFAFDQVTVTNGSMVVQLLQDVFINGQK